MRVNSTPHPTLSLKGRGNNVGDRLPQTRELELLQVRHDVLGAGDPHAIDDDRLGPGGGAAARVGIAAVGVHRERIVRDVLVDEARPDTALETEVDALDVTAVVARRGRRNARARESPSGGSSTAGSRASASWPGRPAPGAPRPPNRSRYFAFTSKQYRFVS